MTSEATRRAVLFLIEDGARGRQVELAEGEPVPDEGQEWPGQEAAPTWICKQALTLGDVAMRIMVPMSGGKETC